MVPPASDKIPRVPAVLRIPLGFDRISEYRVLHLLRPGFRSRSSILSLAISWSFNPGPWTGLGFSPFARRYSGNHCCFLFLRVLRCFSSPGTSLDGHVFTCRWQLMSAAEVPHSDTSASSLPYSFTELFAVWRVLLRFSVARHSPYALPYLISGSRVFRDVLSFKNFPPHSPPPFPKNPPIPVGRCYFFGQGPPKMNSPLLSPRKEEVIPPVLGTT